MVSLQGVPRALSIPFYGFKVGGEEPWEDLREEVLFQFHFMDSLRTPGVLVLRGSVWIFQFHFMDSPQLREYIERASERLVRFQFHFMDSLFINCRMCLLPGPTFNSILWIQETSGGWAPRVGALYPFNSILWILTTVCITHSTRYDRMSFQFHFMDSFHPPSRRFLVVLEDLSIPFYGFEPSSSPG